MEFFELQPLDAVVKAFLDVGSNPGKDFEDQY